MRASVLCLAALLVLVTAQACSEAGTSAGDEGSGQAQEDEGPTGDAGLEDGTALPDLPADPGASGDPG